MGIRLSYTNPRGLTNKSMTSYTWDSYFSVNKAMKLYLETENSRRIISCVKRK